MMRNRLDIPSRPGRRPPDTRMVPRLRVAVRVISEDEYLTHLAQGSPGPGLYRGEKKFPVVIPNPQQWQIGHLVAEIKRQFKQLYGRDIGTIKYISHGFDDCQLHKDLSVFEHLYDEGRARADAGDQYVVVKAVYSEGGPLREGSVLPDFDDPRHENRPIPPVPIPSWSDAPPNSGKRLAEEYYDQDFRANHLPDIKRQRLNDVEDGDSDEDVAQSVERDVQMQAAGAVFPTSQTVIHDSQSSLQDEPVHSVRQPFLPTSGPTSLRHSRNATSERAVPSATRPNADDISKNHTEMPLSISHKQLLYDPNHGKTQALLTPPSDASKKTSSGETRPSLVPGFKRKFSPAQGTSSGLLRPSAVKNNIYDMDEPEDIECSLMSPKSKLAMNKKFPRSSPGSKSSRSRKEKDTPDRHRGTVPHSEIVKLMKDGRSIRADASARSRQEVSHNSPEDDFTADEDGHGRRGDVLQIQNASIAASQSMEHVIGPLTTFSMPKDNVQPKSIPKNPKNDVNMDDHAAASNSPTANLEELEDASENSAGLAPRRISVSDRGKLAMTTESGTVPVSKEAANTPVAAEVKRRRKRKSRIDDEAIEPLNVDTTRPKLDTEQSTPVDSPGEQLLEMQASSQKSGKDSQPKDSKKAEKQTRTKQEKQKRTKQEKVAGFPKNPAADSGTTKQQKPKLDQNVQPIEAPITLANTAIEASARSDTVSKSPYARESPPKGSIGLGFTNSPRRLSTVIAESTSLGQRKPFQDKLAPAESIKSDALKHNESSDSEDESSDSTAVTPSKQARPEKVQMPYQRYIAKSTLTLQTSESTKPESPRCTYVTLPPGMTLEQFEARKKQHEAKIANGEEAPKERKPSAKKTNKEREAQAELALLARTSSKETASSVAPSERAEPRARKTPAKEGPAKENAVTVAPQEEPGPKMKRAPKKESAEKEVAVAKAGSTTEKTNTMSAAAVEKQQKNLNKGIAKAASIPSTMASESSKGSQLVASHVTSTPAAPAVKVIVSNSAKPNTVEPGNRLKNLRNRVADKGASNSPVPQTFAPPPKPAAKKFTVRGDLSDDDSSSSSSDENDDLDEKTAKLIAASKPDQSTRSAAADSDEDMDDDSDEAEDEDED